MAKKSDRRQEINTYEEARKQRLQDNLKRFEDLGILKISKSLSEIANSEKKSPQHPAKPKPKRSIDMLELRRSSRARNLVNYYSEEPDIRLPRKRSKTSSSWKSYLSRPVNEVKFASDEERACAIHNAEMLQSNLGSKNPSFVKSMVRSHVYSCFWMGLPNKFCKDHLPLREVNMILEDEAGLEYDAIYIGSRCGLSGGWRAFALDHKLDDGDALVFELSEPTRFKIYTVRAFNRAASKSRMEETGFNGESEVKDEIIEAKVQKEKKDEKGNRSASSKQKKKARVGGKSEFEQKKIVENGDKSVSLKSQQHDDGNKLSRKKSSPTKLFRRKVY